MSEDQRVFAFVDYEDPYVQPLLIEALKARIPPEILVLIKDASELPCTDSRFIQWLQYEKIDFDHLVSHPGSSLTNSYVIRKALIRKHYLSNTVTHWLAKNPDSVLRSHIKSSVEFEVDFAEFLDDALVEAFELKESWDRNAELGENEDHKREWWILKPGMSDRGQGIRLFSSEEELHAIFSEWDPPSDDEDEDEFDEADRSARYSPTTTAKSDNAVITSQLRHFIAQPYIAPPLLLPDPHPSANRKFHIRSYVLATGALRLHIYRPMLALFAAEKYTPPHIATDLNNPVNLARYLTNTCLQTGEREGSVHTFWSLPDSVPNLSSDWKDRVFDQICETTSQTFLAAARAMGVHFQPLPNAFELFGVDFLVDAEGTAWLMEVNAFPDFAQTGPDLREVVAGLMRGVVEVGVKPFFGLRGGGEGADGKETETDMVEVLDVDLGRR